MKFQLLIDLIEILKLSNHGKSKKNFNVKEKSKIITCFIQNVKMGT
jgi:hypothetical protein